MALAEERPDPAGSLAGMTPFTPGLRGPLLLAAPPALCELLAAWAEQAAPQAPRLLASEPEELQAALQAVRPELALIEASPALLEAWAQAGPPEAALWLALSEPRLEPVLNALRARPTGLLSVPLGAALVEGHPVASDTAALLARASALGEPGALSRHAHWLRALLEAHAAAPEAWPLLRPLIEEHVCAREAELAMNALDPLPDSVPIASLLAPAAWRQAPAALTRGVRLRLGAAEGRLALRPGPAHRLLAEAVAVLAESVPPGGTLRLEGDEKELRLHRDPGPAAGPAEPPKGVAKLLEMAFEADARLSLDEAAWPTLSIAFGAPQVPIAPIEPRVVLLEPDPMLRAWVYEQPGGRAIHTLPWRPGQPVPAAARAPGTLVMADPLFLPELSAAAPELPLMGQPLRARFGQGRLGLLVPAARPTGPLPPEALSTPIPAATPAPEPAAAPASAPTPPASPPPAEQGPSHARAGLALTAAVLVAAGTLVGASIGMVNRAPGAPAPQPAAAEAPADWSTAQSASRTAREVVVSLSERRLSVTEGPRELARFMVAVGKADSPTPTGTFKITSVVPDPPYQRGRASKRPHSQDPTNPLGTHWLGINAPALGLHGTAAPEALGEATSDGCIRLANPDIEALAALVEPGTRVRIQP